MRSLAGPWRHPLSASPGRGETFSWLSRGFAPLAILTAVMAQRPVPGGRARRRAGLRVNGKIFVGMNASLRPSEGFGPQVIEGVRLINPFTAGFSLSDRL